MAIKCGFLSIRKYAKTLWKLLPDADIFSGLLSAAEKVERTKFLTAPPSPRILPIPYRISRLFAFAFSIDISFFIFIRKEKQGGGRVAPTYRNFPDAKKARVTTPHVRRDTSRRESSRDAAFIACSP